MKTLHQILKNFKQQVVNTIRSPKKIFLLVFFFFSLSIVSYIVATSLVISYGNSVDGKVFLKTSATRLSKNDYVIIQSSPDDIFSKGVLLTKKIACSSKEVLEIVGHDYYCNAEYLGRAKLKSKSGIPVEPFNPCGAGTMCRHIIPEKFYFVLGDNIDSYDSRYFGPVPEEKIVARLYKIW